MNRLNFLLLLSCIFWTGCGKYYLIPSGSPYWCLLYYEYDTPISPMDSLLSPISIDTTFVTGALDRHLGRLANAELMGAFSSYLLKKYFIVIWREKMSNAQIFDYIHHRYYPPPQAAAIAFPMPFFDRDVLIFDKKHIEDEFNRMIERENIIIDNFDKAVDLSKLYIKCAALGESKGISIFLESLLSFEDFLNEYNFDEYKRRYKGTRQLVFDARSKKYKEIEVKEEEFIKALEERFKELRGLLRWYKPSIKIWKEQERYVVELYTYSPYTGEVLKWTIKVAYDGAIKASVSDKSFIWQLFSDVPRGGEWPYKPSR